MKYYRSILTTLLLTLFVGTSAFAADIDRSSTSIKKHIANRMIHPGDGLEGVVYVHFTVDAMGHVQIMDMDSSDERLELFVKDKLEDLDMKKTITDPGDEHHMHFVFKTDE